MNQHTEKNCNSIREAMKKYALSMVLLLLLPGLSLSGCAGTAGMQASELQQEQYVRQVNPGDDVYIHFLCRFKNGDPIADSSLAADAEPKADNFYQIGEKGTLLIKAVNPDEPLSPRLFRPAPFDIELLERLARRVTGMKEGESRQLELTAEMIPAENETAGFAWLSKVRTRDRVKRMPVCEYRTVAGKDPEIGQSAHIDPALPGVVEEITDTEVVIRFSPKLGTVVETPFGQGRIREEGDHYKIDIDAQEGSIVITGAKIGRITHVDDRVITVDYRHPFGYEELVCDTTVVRISEAQTVAAGNPE